MRLSVALPVNQPFDGKSLRWTRRFLENRVLSSISLSTQRSCKLNELSRWFMDYRFLEKLIAITVGVFFKANNCMLERSWKHSASRQMLSRRLGLSLVAQPVIYFSIFFGLHIKCSLHLSYFWRVFKISQVLAFFRLTLYVQLFSKFHNKCIRFSLF